MLLEILPVEEIKRRFPDAEEYIIAGRKELPRLEKEVPDKLNALALHQWDRLVEWGPKKVEKYAIADYANGKPGGLKFISNYIGQPLINDIAYQRYTVQRNQKPITVAQLMVAHLYPGDLHLVDVKLCNPDKPLDPATRKPHQYYEGLGLLRPIVDKLIETARALGCRAISLTAAGHDLKSQFEHVGFEVSDTFVGREVSKITDRALIDSGVIGIPMEIRI